MADDQRTGRDSRELAGWIAAGLLLLGLLAFVLQNSRKVRVEWLFWDLTLPLWLLVTLTAVAGAALARVVGRLVRRRRR